MDEPKASIKHGEGQNPGTRGAMRCRREPSSWPGQSEKTSWSRRHLRGDLKDKMAMAGGKSVHLWLSSTHQPP